MNVLLINQYFHPDISATSLIITDLCIELTRYFNISVLCGAPSYNPAESLTYKLFKFYTYKDCRVMRVWNTSFSRRTFKGRILNYLTFMATGCLTALLLKKSNATFAMTDPPFVGFIAYMINKIKRVPYVVTLQDIHPDIEIHTGLLKKSFLVSAWIKLNKLIFNNAVYVIVLGNTMKDYLKDAYGLAPEKIKVIPNYSDDEKIIPQPKQNKFLNDKPFKDKFIITHSGNMGLNQDLHIIVESAKLLKDNQNIAFVFIGDGAMKESLLASVKNNALSNIHFLPYEQKENLSFSLSAADVHLITLGKGLTRYILPSKLYGIMAVGRPIIACIDEDSDVAHIIEEAQCGLVIEPGNPETLANAISWMYKNKSDLPALGENARQYLENNLRKSHVVEKYRELFSSFA